MRNLTTSNVEPQALDETLTKQFDELIDRVREVTAQRCAVHSADGGLSRHNEEKLPSQGAEAQHEASR
jgi:hypothetical protein